MHLGSIMGKVNSASHRIVFSPKLSKLVFSETGETQLHSAFSSGSHILFLACSISLVASSLFCVIYSAGAGCSKPV